MPKAYCTVMYGMGGKPIDKILTENGTGKLVRKLRDMNDDLKVVLFDPTQVEEAFVALSARPAEEMLIIGGTSLGANFAPHIAKRLAPRTVRYMFGIQPSLYGARFDYPSNVLEARCIWNPIFLLTMGFGWRKLLPADGNVLTRVVYQKSWLLHPGDAGWTVHEPIMFDIARILELPPPWFEEDDPRDDEPLP